jgi:hypothetical protein
MPTSAALPDTITPRTRAQTHTTRLAPPSTTARQHHGPCHPKQRAPTSHARHIYNTQHTNTQVPHARATSHTAATTPHCANITARTPPHVRHTRHGTQLRPPHTPPTENHTQSHTRPPRHTHRRAVRLPSVDGMLPESWLMCKLKDLQDTPTAIAHTIRPKPVAHNASQRIASHSINQIKSNESQSAH